MGVRFFGQFLLEHGVITSEQLLAALAYQDRMNQKFGETAIQLGLLDRPRVEKIIALQRHEDLKAGEAGIKLGYLTPEQVDQILRTQQTSHVMLGEALVQTHALTAEQLAEHLATFNKDQDPYRLSSGLPHQKDPTGLAAPAIDLTVKFLGRFANLPTKLVDIRYQLAPSLDGPVHTVCVGFTGTHNGELGLRATQPLLVQIASGMLGSAVPGDATADILDAACEFLNVVGGNLAAAADRQGKRVELLPPRTGLLSVAGRDVAMALLATPSGMIEFMVVTDPVPDIR